MGRKIKDIEIFTKTHIITGILGFCIETEDLRFDYEYGSISGTGGSINVIAGELDTSELKVFDLENEDGTTAVFNYKFTEDDFKALYKEVEKHLPSYEELKRSSLEP